MQRRLSRVVNRVKVSARSDQRWDLPLTALVCRRQVEQCPPVSHPHMNVRSTGNERLNVIMSAKLGPEQCDERRETVIVDHPLVRPGSDQRCGDAEIPCKMKRNPALRISRVTLRTRREQRADLL
jgi:hypothetical protein